MARCPALPFLPGYTFNPMIGRTNFRIDPIFDFNAGIPCLVEKVKPNMFGPLSDRYPSIYARGEVSELPAWIAFDKQILAFDGFYQQTLQEMSGSAFQIHKVKILFYLEDGTIQVYEPKVENSGIMQGTLIARQRIRFPPPMDENFYDIIDFNVGRSVEFFGKVFKITSCDKFTRVFLNRCGIAVPDPLNTPLDPYAEIRFHERDGQLPKKPNRKVDVLGKFLANDRKLLRFLGYWDDRESAHGEFHELEIFYYLSDDTIEIKDIVPANAGRDSGFMFLKRSKLPKVYKGLPGPGATAPFTVLNVLGPGLAGGRMLADALNCGSEKVEYYQEQDLTVGGVINCYGRRIILTDCDKFTKEYYRVKYGLDTFVTLKKPVIKEDKYANRLANRELPPWNGFGSHEDSAQNCITVEPKAPCRDFKKFLKYDKNGLDSHILRFEARMISKIKENCDRIFVISFYLSDDTMAVNEIAVRNSGFKQSQFLRRDTVKLPGQAYFTSKPPKCYKPQHMYVGAQLIINSYFFVLINADEYALRFMEINCHEYPKANIELIMNKVRETLKPIYKDFVAENIPIETKTIRYDVLRQKLCPIMGEEFTEHEMITISRAFSANCLHDRYDRQTIRAITLTELKRMLWDDLERTRECFLSRDENKTGKLTKQQCYTVLKGCRLPIDQEILERILQVVDKDENCNIFYEDIINFLDRSKCPLSDVVPVNVKYDLWWGSEREPTYGILVDWCKFNEYLDLEKLFTM